MVSLSGAQPVQLPRDALEPERDQHEARGKRRQEECERNDDDAADDPQHHGMR